MGIMGACLPFLAQLFRQRFLEMVDALPFFRSRNQSQLQLHHKPTVNTRDAAKHFDADGDKRGPSDEYEILNEGESPAETKFGDVTTKARTVHAIV